MTDKLHSKQKKMEKRSQGAENHRDMVLLYDNKFVKHPCKLQMDWLGPYVIHFMTDRGAV